MKSFLSILLLCGLVKPQVRVINGDTAAPFSYPFIVSLQAEGNHFCGGSLLDRETVLTAAHCNVEGLKDITANLHRHDLSKKPEEEKGIRIEVDKKFIHSKFDANTMLADVMIWKLKTKIPENIKVDFVELSKGALEQDLTLKNLTSAGWGKTEDGKGNDGKGATLLQVAHFKPVEGKICKQKWLEHVAGADVSDKLCVKYNGNKKQSICNGDSGGPLVYFDRKINKFILVGLVSLGELKCTLANDIPDAFNRVEPYVDWIHKHYGTKKEVKRCHKKRI